MKIILIPAEQGKKGYLGIVMINLLLMLIMIMALAGMVLCGRKQRRQTKFQFVALILLVIVIASGGMFMCRIDALAVLGLDEQENAHWKLDGKLQEAQGYVVANYIKNSVPDNCRILLISQDGNEEFAGVLQQQIVQQNAGSLVHERLNYSAATQDKLISPLEDRAAESREIDAAIARNRDANVVILSGISPSGDSLHRLKVYQIPYSRRPRIIVLGLTNLDLWVESQVKNGYFDALVINDMTRQVNMGKLPENPIELFNSCFVLITSDNLSRNLRFFHH